MLFCSSRYLLGSVLIVLAAACATDSSKAGREHDVQPAIRVTPADQLKFTPFDGTQPNGAQVATLFGEIGKPQPTGFLLKTPPGFRPGPHTHSSDDYAVVIRGNVHNFAAGGSEGIGVGLGGTWFQPGGVDNHCESESDCLIFVYTPERFDFLPTDGGSPVSEEASGIVVTPADQVRFMPLDPAVGNAGPHIAVLFGALDKKAPIGLLFAAPAGFRPGPHVHSSDDYAVVLRGKVQNFAAGQEEGPAVGPGGTWFQPANVVHDNYCESAEPCLFFVYLPGGFDFEPRSAASTR
jgi:quercetin dioxygenase-like cupin family protein